MTPAPKRVHELGNGDAFQTKKTQFLPCQMVISQSLLPKAQTSDVFWVFAV